MHVVLCSLVSPGPGEGPFPAVLDLWTFGGGLSEKRASLLASRGFVVLTIALYGHDDMPSHIKVVHLDYFEEAIEFLKKQDKVSSFMCSCKTANQCDFRNCKKKPIVALLFCFFLIQQVGSNGVGVISLSKSGDLALSVASYLPGVEATVWINGCCSNTAFPLYYKGSQIHSALMYDRSKSILTETGALVVKNGIDNPLAEENEGSLIPIERAKGRFLFVASEDDLNWDSKSYMEVLVERLKRYGKDNYESVSYPRAGHYLEPPYGPYCPSCVHGLVGKPVLWGGEPRSHAVAEVHAWTKIQEFFRTHLRWDATQTNAKL